MFVSPREDTTLTFATPHHLLYLSWSHSLRFSTVCDRVLEVNAMLMQQV